jgi:hypothetical protein
LAFQETMRGSVQTPSGESSTIEFDVIAESLSLREFLRSGMTQLRGVVRAPAWADEVPGEGSLRLSPSALEYRVRFVGRQGEQLTLEGIKRPSLLAPLSSMTNMEATLRDERSTVLARGTMKFDLREILEFGLSWVPVLPLGRLGRRALDARRLAIQRAEIEGGQGELSLTEGGP